MFCALVVFLGRVCAVARRLDLLPGLPWFSVSVHCFWFTSVCVFCVCVGSVLRYVAQLVGAHFQRHRKSSHLIPVFRFVFCFFLFIVHFHLILHCSLFSGELHGSVVHVLRVAQGNARLCCAAQCLAAAKCVCCVF